MEWNNLSRLNEDVCAQTISEKQSQMVGLYHVQTPGFRWCESQKSYSMMMSEPAHEYKQYRNGCVIDKDSQLRYNNLTNLKYINQLYTRPYLGNFMGAGQRSEGLKDIESELIMGLDTRGIPRTACDVLSEVSINRFESLPEYGNPQKSEHIIEPWVRGGDATRDYIRRVNYETMNSNQALNHELWGTSLNPNYMH